MWVITILHLLSQVVKGKNLKKNPLVIGSGTLVCSWFYEGTCDTSLVTSCRWTPPRGRSTEPARG